MHPTERDESYGAAGVAAAKGERLCANRAKKRKTRAQDLIFILLKTAME